MSRAHKAEPDSSHSLVPVFQIWEALGEIAARFAYGRFSVSPPMGSPRPHVLTWFFPGKCEA